LCELGAVGILLVVHATMSNAGDAKNNNRFAIGISPNSIGEH
jgi:hypothetical protein